MLTSAARPPGKRSLIQAALLALALGAVLAARATISRRLVVEAFLDRGARWIEQGETARAEAEWEAAARLAPRNPTAYRALGTLRLRQGRLVEARDALHRLADVAPREPHALCELAEAELRSGQTALLEPAAWDGSRAAALEPDCARAQTVAGNAWLTRGDTRRAVQHLRRATALNPADLPLTLHLAKTLLDAQRAPEAAEIAQGLVRRYPGFAEGYFLLATCFETYPPASREFRSVPDQLSQALRLDPTHTRAQARTGYHLLAAGDPHRALRHLEAARLLGARDGATLFDLSRAYAALGRRADAERIRREFQRGSVLENEAAALEKRLLLDPGNEALYRRLETVSRALGDPGRARRARLRGGEAGPSRPREES